MIGVFNGLSGSLGGRPAVTATVAGRSGLGSVAAESEEPVDAEDMLPRLGGLPGASYGGGRVSRTMNDTSPTRKPRIALVFGGRSSEHAISCVTAGSVLRAIDLDRYDVLPIGITPEGRWVLESDDPERLAITSADKLPEVDPTRSTVALTNTDGRSELVVHEPSAVPHTLGEVDVVFPLLHGPWGEDGTIQGLLEMAGVRYVGAGVLASAVGMDKHFMKVVFQARGLPVLPYALITPRQWETDRTACQEAVDSLGYPVFVKPCRGGSSIGISKVHDRSELDDAVEAARVHDPKVISRSQPRAVERSSAG